MSDKSSSSASGGVGFFGLLTLLFVGLKLTNYIDWSWWWVFSPLWIGWAIVLGFIVVSGIVLLIVAAISAMMD